MSNNQAGKGDKPRPIKKGQYDNNFDKIVWTQPTQAKTGVAKRGKTTYKY
jgi:hypothetical protein